MVASFRATLEEAEEADLLLHVVDLSQKNYQSQVATVEAVLKELGIGEKPIVVVYNKIDRLDEDPMVPQGDESVVAVSALTGAGLSNLQRTLVELSAGDSVTLDLEIPMADGKLLAQLRERGEIIEEEYRATDVRLHVRLDRTWAERWQLEKFVAG